MDGRTRPERIAEVLQGVGADIIALQEVVGAGHRHGGHAELLGAALGMGWVMAPTRQLWGHQFGNVVLARFPVVRQVPYNLSWKTCEPRGCVRVDLDVEGMLLHFYNVHFGTAILERRLGMTEVSVSHHGHALATFPSILPMLRLDRIYVRGFKVAAAQVHKGKPWSMLSDHLAVSAELSRV